MSDPALFGMGVLVTLIVVAALGVLIWGATLDGRYEREQRRAEEEPAELLGSDPHLRVVDAA